VDRSEGSQSFHTVSAFSWTWAGLLLAATTTGCLGARTDVVAKDASVPVSLSRAVRGPSGSVVPLAKRHVVGHFHEERTAWGMLYSAIPFNPTTDISQAIDTQVTQSGGDAITRLEVTARSCTLSYFAFPFGILPFWPGCTNLEIDGDIVKVDR